MFVCIATCFTQFSAWNSFRVYYKEHSEKSCDLHSGSMSIESVIAYKSELIFQTLAMAAFAIVIGLICFQLEDDYTGFQNRSIIMYDLTVNMCVIIELEHSFSLSRTLLLEAYYHWNCLFRRHHYLCKFKLLYRAHV